MEALIVHSLIHEQEVPMTERTHKQLLTRDQGLIGGLPKRLVNNQTLLVDGTSYTAATAESLLQTRVDALTAVVNAEAAYKLAVKAADAAVSATAATVSGLVEAIYTGFGEDAGALADFQLPERKKPVVSPQARIAAAAKAKATRAARHTTGAKQKAAITGNVTGVTITPVVAPGTTPTATSTPAAAAGGSGQAAAPVPAATAVTPTHS
jgi:hypothetical protein